MTAAAFTAAADANQRKASDPRASAWVSANAGTGKTTVLVNRMLRLLLEGNVSAQGRRGVAPERILCLTYTKTAAAEMENRLLRELAGWATMADEALSDCLARLCGRTATPDDLAAARRLFATTLEAKGGLKIHTIHAFCERILKRFPIEANVPPGFAVLDDLARRVLLDQAVDAVLDRAARAPEGRLGRALGEVIANVAEESFRGAIEAMLSHRQTLQRMMDEAADATRLAEGEELALRRLFGVRPGASEASLQDEMAAVLDDETLEAATSALAGGGTNDAKRAAAFAEARRAPSRERRIECLCAALLKQDGGPRQAVANKDTAAAHRELVGRLEAARDALHALDLQLMGLRVAAASGALLTLADAILSAYEHAKSARAALDYDDLIARTVSLLTRSGAAAWVLYKLDGGIDHILVDEAQDTSPLQWQVVELLAEEFFAGEGARDTARTIFAVGDEKQSIYSFQGADPAEFGRQGRTFAARAARAGRGWNRVPLTLSFRSAECVLTAVDAVFAQPTARRGLSFDEAPVVHQAYRKGHPGLVEMWPVEAPGERSDTDAFDPLGEQDEGGDPVTAVAGRIADRIRAWLDEGAVLESSGRPITPGDILILVRRREPFTRPMIRALKARGIAVAGADRMKLAEQIAVMDLMALGDVLLMPEDDLQLAAVLKSPLFGFDDDDLFELAHQRNGSLWQALRRRTADKPAYAAVADRLQSWLARTDYLAPYEFYAGLLDEDGMAMRRAMLARLGPDAGDAIDEFLNLALAYDAAAPASLQGFLHWARHGDIEVKRDMEQGRDEVRIMTVHGAKGLEAGIVILPDTCTLPRGAGRQPVVAVERPSAPPGVPPHLVWAIAGAGRLPPVAQARARLSEAERDEHNRLLYVAMTRARDRLYACGWDSAKKRPDGAWYDLVAEGLKPLAKEVAEGPQRTVWRYAAGDRPPPPLAAAPRPEPLSEPPAWASRPAPREAPGTLMLAPSALAARHGRTAEQPVASPLHLADGDRFLRGNLVHGLLQHLPVIEPARWQEAAERYVARHGPGLDQTEQAAIIAETLAVLRDPALGALFGPGSLAEVPIVARLDTGGGEDLAIAGQIDRLVIGTDRIIIVDYKTNRPPPERPDQVAPAYVAQLAAYRAAIAALHPGARIDCALLWTAGPRLMPIPAARLEDARALLLPPAAP